mmetsp:Transcript_51944/g.62459  ORF Transcript_51944/g.62459 Transcript_51944/m.62459 type:complete len:104 (-) Transcript_51944:14-325(-)
MVSLDHLEVPVTDVRGAVGCTAVVYKDRQRVRHSFCIVAIDDEVVMLGCARTGLLAVDMVFLGGRNEGNKICKRDELHSDNLIFLLTEKDFYCFCGFSRSCKL